MRLLTTQEISAVSGGSTPYTGTYDPNDEYTGPILVSGVDAYGGLTFGYPMGFDGQEGEGDGWTEEDIEYAREVVDNPDAYPSGEVQWAQNVVDHTSSAEGSANGALIGAVVGSALGPLGAVSGAIQGGVIGGIIS